jgi:peptidoglycan/LPS O-acetylase OafA/YrhL
LSEKPFHRRDIDGLRAIAIAPVVLFHGGVPGFSGGYVGVDVFFVVSGFLITGIIASAIDRGEFSLIGFYERRARRILPALLAVIAFVLAAAAAVYLPGDFESVPRSALAALLFVSNVTFFLETGYFQGGADTKPLLHTWSLGIEEQFYIGFPLLLLLIARLAANRRVLVVWLLALVSFWLAVGTQTDKSGIAFYLLPPRAWELLTGALLALGSGPEVKDGVLRESLALGGLALIGFAVATFDAATIFPGTNALFPVVGAALLIHCAPNTRVGQLLGWAPFVGVGLISYSLYLWHWPLFVFAAYVTDAKLAGWASAFAIFAAIGVAVLSWRFIEQPFRVRGRFDRRKIFVLGGSAMAGLCTVALAMVAAGGWPERFPSEVVRMASAQNDISPYRGRCHDSDAVSQRPPCVLGAPVAPTALVWGDSHGVELSFALSEQAKAQGRSLVERTQSSCPPLLGYDPRDDPRCARVNRSVLAQIAGDPHLQTVYLVGFWDNRSYHVPGFEAQLQRTIAWLVEHDRRVFLVGPIPSHASEVPRKLAHHVQFAGADRAIAVARSPFHPTETALRAIAAGWPARDVAYLDPAAALCEGDRCFMSKAGAPLYFDSHHLSVAGARLVVRTFPGAPAMQVAALTAPQPASSR